MTDQKKFTGIFLGLLVLIVVVVGFQVLYLNQAEKKLRSSSISPTAIPVPTKAETEKKAANSLLLEIISPQDGQTVSLSQIKVQGRTVAGAEVFVNEKEVVPDKNGNFSATVGLQEGENVLLIAAGNESGDAEVERTVYFEQ